jgi:hypothetical protein
MIYEFRYAGVNGKYEVVGTGQGSGDTAPLDAFEDLRDQREDELPPGEYQYRPASSAAPGIMPSVSIGTDWAPLMLDAEGSIDY